MEHTQTTSAGSTRVRVAVNVRPLLTAELLHGCTNCITVPLGEPQIQIGKHLFTYDYVYTGSPTIEAVYKECVAPLVDTLFQGYNATVLAYGQTGSGKSVTMGTNYTGEDGPVGIIPQVMTDIFKRAQDSKDESSEFLTRVSFIEILKEEVYDLLGPSPNASKGELAGNAKFTGPARVPIQIRETSSGGITLAGVSEPEVKTKKEMYTYLSRGSMSRATGNTNISQSSRSHLIFTVAMEQKNGLSAKLHLVDLAGSEGAKRTGADGMRLKEVIHINKGLLTLGNVISALGDERKRKGGHVPYRDSKLTRLLQDSLGGGNSKTVMIACVSPADTNVEETLDTLKYANRVRNIQNKAIINRDPMGAQQQRLQSRIDQLEAEREAELLCFKGLGGVPSEETRVCSSDEKESRKNEYERHALLGLNQRREMVLQRKTEEASLATKRLKEKLLESPKASSRETGISPAIQPWVREIEHELDVIALVHEVRQEHARQTEEHERQYSSGVPMSTTLVSMESQLSKADEQKRGSSGKGCWHEVRSLADAKDLMTYLFNLASSSRCLLREIELTSSQKDMEISYLENKIVELNLMRSERSESMRHHYDLRKRSTISSTISSEDLEKSDPESDYDVYCSCSKYSSCKTSRCVCRAARVGCESSCLCLESKCVNRGGSNSSI